YAFGYGLSYTHFEYSDVSLDATEIGPGDTLTASVTVTNAGDTDGEEVVQLYIRDLVGSVTRPVKQLKGFQKIRLAAGESRSVHFSLNADDLAFYRADMSYGSEPGDFELFIGGASDAVHAAHFRLTGGVAR
ncbi:MAG: fibronectin type III-like domain-contianing protein, partial [Woeseiaceae bacterium]